MYRKGVLAKKLRELEGILSRSPVEESDSGFVRRITSAEA
jgi:hypothetical protein